MQLPDDKSLAWYERHGQTPPAHHEHKVVDSYENPLSGQLLEAHPRNWRLEGNVLICDTDFGPLRQGIPVDYICLGDGPDGLPLLRKIG